MLKARAKLINNADWKKGIRGFCDKAEFATGNARSCSTRQHIWTATRGSLSPSQPRSCSTSWTSKKKTLSEFPFNDIKAAIATGEAALGAGVNLLEKPRKVPAMAGQEASANSAHLARVGARLIRSHNQGRTHVLKIWRYVDLPKFVNMLATGTLHFACVSSFNDPYEGWLPRSYMEAMVKLARAPLDQMRQMQVALNPSIHREWETLQQDAERKMHTPRLLKQINEKIRRASCWHINEGEFKKPCGGSTVLPEPELPSNLPESGSKRP